MKCRVRVLALALAAGMAFVSPLAAARDLTSLQGEFWVDFEPMGSEGPAKALTHDEALKALLEEARVVFSAMVYGYDFSYRPSDKARQVEDAFLLDSVGQIPWGDQDMEFRETRADQSSLYLRVRYLNKPSEIARLEAWAGSHTLDAGSNGAASYYLGVGGKIRAFEEACKQAIRDYVRGMTLNKPGRIEGHFILADMPRVIVVDGQYRYSVRLKLQLDEIQAYRNW